MSKKKKLLLLVPDGTGIKNYLLSSFIEKAADKFDLILAHNFDHAIHNEFPISTEQYTSISIPEYNENFKHKFLREALCYARLNYNANIKSNPTILINWRRQFSNVFKNLFYRLVEIYGNVLSKQYKRIEKHTRKYHNLLKNSTSILAFKNILEEHQPDIVMTTHQRSVYNVPLFAAAKALNIPSVSAIYSWDNMPKARIPYYSDYFMVWSAYMKSEFKTYYPDIDLNKVLITGTPQFEFYENEILLQTKEEFYNQHGLDLDRPVVCFSGDDRLTSPFDPEYLDDMAKVFSSLPKSKQPQIILRPCPADDGSRFKPVLEKYPQITLALPDWFEQRDNKHWSVKFPKQNDIAQLVNLAYHADAVINVGSTMAHDFAMFEKPAFYLNYQPQPKNYTVLNAHKKTWKIHTIYKYEHFKSMADLNPVFWINSPSDFKTMIQKLYSFEDNVKADQKKWRDKIIGKAHVKQASQQMVNQLINLS